MTVSNPTKNEAATAMKLIGKDKEFKEENFILEAEAISSDWEQAKKWVIVL